MDDQPHALRPGVPGDFRQVVIGIRLREREGVAVLDPVAVPAGVPPLDEHTAESVGGGEVDHPFRVGRRGSVLRSRAPGEDAQMHPPPDPDVLHRLDPVGLGESVRWIEVEAEHRGREIGDVVGHLDRAPRRHERRMASDLDSVRHWSERRSQGTAFHARSGEKHPRVVLEVGLVDHHAAVAVRELERERRLHAVQRAHGGRREQLFRAIQSRPVGRDPPRFGIVGQGELRELVRYLERTEAGLLGELVAEAHAIVEGSDPHGEPPLRGCGLLDGHGQLVVLVTHPGHLAPRLGPRFVVCVAGGVGDAQAVPERRCSLELEAEE